MDENMRDAQAIVFFGSIFGAAAMLGSVYVINRTCICLELPDDLNFLLTILSVPVSGGTALAFLISALL